MQIGTKFSIAIHILLCVEFFKNMHKVTGDFIARSIKSNPTIIRNVMALLRNADLIAITAGTGGAKLARPAERINMNDVYQAVSPVKNRKLFKIHANSEPQCPIGRNIVMLLDPVFASAQGALENDLGTSTVQDLLDTLNAALHSEYEAAQL
jgi:DNA-binding IscR family transcriptional regulator